MSNGSSKRWCFTVNNPEVQETPEFIKARVSIGKGYKYLVFQLEEGANGTPHWQGFVTFDGMRRLSAVRKMLPRAHWEFSMGSSPSNQHYCTKPVAGCGCKHCINPVPTRLAGPFEDGVCPQGSGDRSDLIQLRDAIKAGKRKRDIVNDDNLFVIAAKYPRLSGIGDLHDLFAQTSEEPPQVSLYYGPTGCGKTSGVRAAYPVDRWESPIGKGGWYDGYDGEENALFDDFAGRASHTDLSSLLRLLDRGGVRVPVKGGFTWFRPKRIFITTNIHPYLWYDWSGRDAQYPALRRRFTNVVAWRGDGSGRTTISTDLLLCARFWESFTLEAYSAPPERVYNPTTREWEVRLQSRPAGGARVFDFLFE